MSHQSKHFYEFGPYRLDAGERLLLCDGKVVPVTPKAFDLLLALVEHHGHLLKKEELLKAVWPDTFVEEANLSWNVSHIRKALGNGDDQERYIETVPKLGYRFVAPVKEVNEDGGTLLTALKPQGNRDKCDDATEADPSSATLAVGLPGKARIIGVWLSANGRWRWWVALFAAVLLFACGTVWYRAHTAGARWARTAGLLQIRHLLKKGELVEAFQLIRQVEHYLSGDPEIAAFRKEYGQRLVIRTSEPGADIYLKDYRADGDWEFLGKSPLETFQSPIGLFRVRVTKPGFESVEFGIAGAFDREVRLFPERSLPPNMMLVRGGNYRPPLENIPAVELPDFWIDKYEVTNRQFKGFVDAGGYRNPRFWKVPFLKNGRLISWEAALRDFRDPTGHPGPSTWKAGNYPEGSGNFPVSGVSWFEAAAYAEFAGKTLPTLYHWYKASGAAGPLFFPMLRLSNCEGTGPAEVGSYRGLGLYGTWDMLGNVKEWCWNLNGPRRYTLGGAWNERGYTCLNPEHRSPFDRSPANGFRCVKSLAPLPNSLTDPIEPRYRDFTNKKPLNDAVFRAHRSMYSYQRTYLNPASELMEETAHWRREKVTFNAAYGKERVIAYLFLPKNAQPLYQTMIYCPTKASLLARSSQELEIDSVDFIVRSGRALMYPVYKDTYERGGGQDLPFGDIAERDRVISWSKDFRRSIDYLETRVDIDREKLGFYGASVGAFYGAIFTGVDTRLKVSVLLGAGLFRWDPMPEVDPFHFASRNRTPTLMVNGKDDFWTPVETAQLPLFRALAAETADKRHVALEGGHFPVRFQEATKEILAWLDRYLGPVHPGNEQ